LYRTSDVAGQLELLPPMVLVPSGSLEESPSPSLDVSVSLPPPPLLAATPVGTANRSSP
jgi:hypothetical protein